jgi:RNA polymerase sigma-70 factor (ECF subfamily)
VQSDAQLVNAVLDGQKDAFAELVCRYERSVRAAAISVLDDHNAAQDAAQEAFIRAYEKLGSLRRASAFGSWLLMIARRCALDAASRLARESSLESSLEFATEDTNGRLDEEKQHLLATVMNLPDSERQVVMLRYFSANSSVKDVAGILGRSVGTVTKQLSRAHKRLRIMLERSE